MSAKLAFKVFALSDLGLVREGNEDSGLVSSNLVAVADGMGGHAGGEVASTIAITALTAKEINEDSLLTVTKEIDLAILNRTNDQPDLAGMGTTLTALHINKDSVELLHVGDSRCYGRITPEEAVSHPQRSLLTHALMGDSGFEPVIQLYPIKLGDQFLICSDGLTGVLSDFEIAKILKKYSGQDLVENLVAETKAKGAPDNVTVIWAEIVLEEDASTTALIGAARA